MGVLSSPKFACVKNDFDFNSAEADNLLNAGKLFSAHVFTFTEEDVARYRGVVDFFGHDWEQKSKRLLEVIL